MSVLMNYFDRERATVEILKAWPDHVWKVKNDPERLLVDKSTPEGAAALEFSKRSKVFLREFQPRWKELDEQERRILVLRYVEGGGVGAIEKELNVGKSEAYRLSKAALERLAKLLFW